MRRQRAVTLLEVLIAFSILTTLFLPVGMFLIEYLRGSNRLGDFHQVMNLLEEKMELALSQPFAGLPVGESENQKLTWNGREVIDLRPIQVGTNLVRFTLKVETVPVEFSAIVDLAAGVSDRVRAEESMKRLTLKGVWGEKGQHSLDLTAFKADL